MLRWPGPGPGPPSVCAAEVCLLSIIGTGNARARPIKRPGSDIRRFDGHSILTPVELRLVAGHTFSSLSSRYLLRVQQIFEKMPRRGASPARAASRSMRGPRLSLVWSQRDATSGLDREPDSQRPPGDQDSRTSTDDEYTTAERDTEERNAELVPATEVLPSLQPSTQAGGRILYRLSCL